MHDLHKKGDENVSVIRLPNLWESGKFSEHGKSVVCGRTTKTNIQTRQTINVGRCEIDDTRKRKTNDRINACYTIDGTRDRRTKDANFGKLCVPSTVCKYFLLICDCYISCKMQLGKGCFERSWHVPIWHSCCDQRSMLYLADLKKQVKEDLALCLKWYPFTYKTRYMPQYCKQSRTYVSGKYCS